MAALGWLMNLGFGGGTAPTAPMTWVVQANAADEWSEQSDVATTWTVQAPEED